MTLTFEQKLNEILVSNNFGVIQIKTSPVVFRKKYFGVSNFFKSLKNGLYSINKVPNRVYFRGLSGVYMSLEMDSKLEIIILYDHLKTPLNSLQVKTRIVKLLGLGTEVGIGFIGDFRDQIDHLLGVKTESRVFGDYYLESNSKV